MKTRFTISHSLGFVAVVSAGLAFFVAATRPTFQGIPRHGGLSFCCGVPPGLTVDPERRVFIGGPSASNSIPDE